MILIKTIFALGIIFLFKSPILTGQQVQIQEIGKNRYFFSDSSPYSPRLNWFLAYQYCRSIGMDLLSMPRQEEAIDVINNLRDNGKSSRSYWTSGNQLGSEMWTWMNSGYPFNDSFSFWSQQGPPLTKTQDGCVELQNGVWYAANCMDEKAFVCHLSRCYYFNYVASGQKSFNGSSRTRSNSTSQRTKLNSSSQTNNQHTFTTTIMNKFPGQDTESTAMMNKFPGQDATNSRIMNKFPGQDTESTTMMNKFPGQDATNSRIMNKFPGQDATNSRIMNKFPGQNTDSTSIMNKFRAQNTDNTRMMIKFPGEEITNDEIMNKFPGNSHNNFGIADISQDLTPPFLNNNEQSSFTADKFISQNTPSDSTINDSNFGHFAERSEERNTNPSTSNSRKLSEMRLLQVSNFGQKLIRNTSRFQPPFLFPGNLPPRQNEIVPQVELGLTQEILPPITSFREGNSANLPGTQKQLQHNLHPQPLPNQQFSRPNSVSNNNKRMDMRNLQRKAQFSWAIVPDV